MIVAFTFTVCHIPFFVLFDEVMRKGVANLNPATSRAHDICFSFNSASNFFIFISTSSAFRKTFCQLFRRRKEADAVVKDPGSEAQQSVNFMRQAENQPGEYCRESLRLEDINPSPDVHDRHELL